MAKDGEPQYTVSAVDRALSLLEALRDAPDSSLSELAERTGCTKSLTFRLLYTLEQRGYAAKEGDRRTYTLGLQAMFLGDQARRQSRLIAAAAPYMAELRSTLGENVLLLVREGLHSVCIALEASAAPQRIFAEVGRRGPLHAGGGPKILLAYAPTEVREAVMGGKLESFTAQTPTAQALSRALVLIRRDGWTVSEGELDFDKCSVAAPVMDGTGAVLAALSVVGPADRFADGLWNGTRDAVVSAAHRLSLALGHRSAPLMES